MTTSTLDMATGYKAWGWCPIDLPSQSKNPGRKGWQLERWSEDQLADRFKNGRGIGVILGAPSGGLVDIDLDCHEAIELADGFLPNTAAVFGREGKRRSHYLYIADDVQTHRIRDEDGATVVELRSTGAQTVFPPSIHPSGEVITWDSRGRPAVVDGADLRRCVERLGAVAMLVRHWPGPGSRHDCALALSGGFARDGWSQNYVRELVELICHVAGDEEVTDRRRAVAYTFENLADDSPTTGWPALGKIMGAGVSACVRQLFGCRPAEPVIAGTANSSTTDTKGGLGTVSLTGVESEDVEWLWPDRIAVGKLTILMGDPGVGKSFAALDIAARVSTGREWPDHRDESRKPGTVLLFTAEDGLGDTIKPRLENANADMDRVHAVLGVRHPEDKDRLDLFSLERDLRHLDDAVQRIGDCRLIVLDPLNAYLGQKVDSHKDADVRRVIAPLAALASRLELAVLMVAHLNKAEKMAAIYRNVGSIGFAAAARACWLICKDREDPTHRLMVQVKNNLASNPGGLGFHISHPGVVLWDSQPTPLTADEALNPERPKASKARDSAAEFLREVLKDGPVAVESLLEEARQAGIAERTLRRAKDDLGVQARPVETDGDRKWYWSLEDGHMANH